MRTVPLWGSALLAGSLALATTLPGCGGSEPEAVCETFECEGGSSSGQSPTEPGDDNQNGTGGSSGAPTETPGVLPFEANTPHTYVNRVKTILTGLAATSAEIEAVASQPDLPSQSQALRSLIDTWMELPQFSLRARDFFRTAFQQDQVSMVQLHEAYTADPIFRMNNTYRPTLERTIMDSFPLTVWHLVNEGRPLTEALTTDTFYLTTAQMVLLAYYDQVAKRDNGAADVRYGDGHIGAARTANNVRVEFSATAPNNHANSINPANANFMRWRARIEPDAEAAITQNCSAAALNNGLYASTGMPGYLLLLNSIFGNERCRLLTGNMNNQNNGQVRPRLNDGDFDNFRPVKIEQTNDAGADVIPFWNWPALRQASTLRLRTQRVGFSGTLAFAANWPTNDSNMARVTINQMLIVGLGYSIAGNENNITTFPEGFDDNLEQHSENPACAGCHVQLDPMSMFVRRSWNLYYSRQRQVPDIRGRFSYAGVDQEGSNVRDLMGIMASHPRFATAWTNKLYFWGTTHSANMNDPEFTRIAGVFKDSNYNFKALVRELFSSPLITFSEATQSTDTGTGGDTLSIARRDQFCNSLSNRLEIADLCGLTTPRFDNTVPVDRVRARIRRHATMIASDTYFRSIELPSLPTSPELFFRASAEAICNEIGTLVVDFDADSRYRSENPNPAIEDMVSVVMALPPGNPRREGAKAILTEHFTQARLIEGLNDRQALISTFQTACLSPSSVIVGL